jgi:hypothetical protein
VSQLEVANVMASLISSRRFWFVRNLNKAAVYLTSIHRGLKELISCFRAVIFSRSLSVFSILVVEE